MLNIDTILPLYPDDASRQLLLSQALAQTQTDLAALRRALATGDRDAALAHTHQAKGTVSFLGCDTWALQRFDQLTHALRNTNTLARPFAQGAPLTQLDAAFEAVESILQDMEAALQACINA